MLSAAQIHREQRQRQKEQRGEERKDRAAAGNEHDGREDKAQRRIEKSGNDHHKRYFPPVLTVGIVTCFRISCVICPASK